MPRVTLTTFIDLLFVLLLVLLLQDNNPAEATNEELPGHLAVTIRWEQAMDADVDLWVQGPEGRPVGYSNLSGKIWNLLRDDLGHRNDFTNENSEIAFSRGAPPGDYSVTVHLYRHSAGTYPVRVHVTISKMVENPYTNASRTTVFTKVVELTAEKQELTVVRFHYENNHVSDLHDMPIKLRPAAKTPPGDASE